jgi:hypothetical protein
MSGTSCLKISDGNQTLVNSHLEGFPGKYADIRGCFSNFLQMGTTSKDGLNIYDSGHRFEHIDLLLVLLQSLPFASPSLQYRALQVQSLEFACKFCMHCRVLPEF